MAEEELRTANLATYTASAIKRLVLAATGDEEAARKAAVQHAMRQMEHGVRPS